MSSIINEGIEILMLWPRANQKTQERVAADRNFKTIFTKSPRDTSEYVLESVLYSPEARKKALDILRANDPIYRVIGRTNP